MLADSSSSSSILIMPRHRPESIRKHGTLLHQLPVVQHKAVLHRALDLLPSTRDNLLVVRRDCLAEAGLARANPLDGVDQVGDVADAVVQALAAVYKISTQALNTAGMCIYSHGGIGCAASPTNVILPPWLSHGCGIQ